MDANISTLLAMSVAVFLGYFCGSIPFGLLIAQTFCHIDPRQQGSKNIGTTNIARLCGKKWGLITLILDFSKGAVPVLLAARVLPQIFGQIPMFSLFSAYWILPLVAGGSAILGHIFPIWLKGKGGKGVATTVGVFFALAPLPFLCSAVLFLLVTSITGFVSAGSLVISVTLPLFLFFFGYIPEAVLAAIMGGCIIIAHKENIKRLLNGTEKTWKQSSQKTTDAPVEHTKE